MTNALIERQYLHHQDEIDDGQHEQVEHLPDMAEYAIEEEAPPYHAMPPPQCNVCHKVFASSKGLQQHYVIHTNERPFQCEICSQTFRFKSNLFEHQSVHTGSLPYSCPYCQKTCRLKGNLKKHLRTHVTTKEELEAAWRPFAKQDPERRRSAPYSTSRVQIMSRTPLGDIHEDNSFSQYSTSFAIKTPKRKTASGLGPTPDRWIKMIKEGMIMPQISLADKLRRFVHATNQQYQRIGDLMELSKSIAFETHSCPVCNAGFMNRDDCDSHCRVEHVNMNTSLFCETCFRSFGDQASFELHQKHHARIAEMRQSGLIEPSPTETVMPYLEDLERVAESLLKGGTKDEEDNGEYMTDGQQDDTEFQSTSDPNAIYF